MGINEGRAKISLGPVTGGGNYLQQQNYSLEALAKRDAQEDPFKTNAPVAPAAPPTPDAEPAAEPAAVKSYSADRINALFARAA
jgi:phage portal protein BeeE